MQSTKYQIQNGFEFKYLVIQTCLWQAGLFRNSTLGFINAFPEGLLPRDTRDTH